MSKPSSAVLRSPSAPSLNSRLSGSANVRKARTPLIKDFVPLAGLDDLVYGGWDIYEDNAYEAACNAQVLERTLVDQLKEPLSALKPMKAVFDPEYVKRINGPNVKQARTKAEKAEMLMQDIEDFRQANGCSRMVMIWCGSTEVFHRPGAVHQTLQDFECGLQKNDPGHRAQPDLRLRCAEERSSVCEWRAQPHHRYARAARTGA